VFSNSTGTVIERDLHGPVAGQDQVIAVESPGHTASDAANATQWLLPDAEGTVHEAAAYGSNPTQSFAAVLTQKFVFDPYGKQTYSSVTSGAGTMRFGYAGQETDAETGYLHELHRYYSVVDGRFIVTVRPTPSLIG
jgi:hypothetical protein